MLLSLLSDYLQFVSGYASSKELLGIAEASENKQAKYNTSSFLYRARTLFFWLKQVFALASLFALLVAVGAAVVCG